VKQGATRSGVRAHRFDSQFAADLRCVLARRPTEPVGLFCVALPATGPPLGRAVPWSWWPSTTKHPTHGCH